MNKQSTGLLGPLVSGCLGLAVDLSADVNDRNRRPQFDLALNRPGNVACSNL